jgi:C4-dicarboxylate-specific signal transduction histidine kinase
MKCDNLNTVRFIGEEIIFLTILGEMFGNSKDAGSTIFKIEVAETDNRIVFSVSDDGSGIPESLQRKIIHDVHTSRSNGLGVGLFLGHKMIQKIGGTISYKGKGVDGKGACFEISFFKEMPS